MIPRLISTFLFVTCTLSAAAAHAQQLVPFEGRWVGTTVAADLSGFPVVAVIAEGQGQFTHLGRAAMVSPHTSNIFTGETIGDQIFTAASGDTVTAHCEGFGLPQPDGSVQGILGCTITTGTGRFAGVRGSYIFSFTATPRPDGGAGFDTVAEFTGSISTVGSNQKP